MSHTYKLIELAGVSETSIDEAIRHAIAQAGKTLRALEWFEVTETRGTIRDGAVGEFQVLLKVGFRVLSEEEVDDA